MVQATTLNTIFGTAQGPARDICVFLCDTRLSLVSKAFQRANAQAMGQVEAQIELRDRISPREIERARREIFGERAGA